MAGVGAVTSFAILGPLIWALRITGLTPVGKLLRATVQSAQAGRPPEETLSEPEFIKLLLQSIWYFEWIIDPVIAIAVGALVGWLARANQWLWALLAIVPMIAFMNYQPLAAIDWETAMLMAVLSAACGSAMGLARRPKPRHQ